MSATQTLGPAFGPTFDEDDRYEVVDGRRVELLPMSARETQLASNLSFLMGPGPRSQGRVQCEALFLLDGENDLQRRPDLSFVSFARWARGRQIPTTNAWAVVPDLACEVVSPSNGFNEILTKVHDYFRCGVRLVWVVLPLFEQVFVFTSPTSVSVLTRDDALDGGDVIRDMRVPLADVFERGDEPA